MPYKLPKLRGVNLPKYKMDCADNHKGSRIYNSNRWHILRTWKLKRNPICEQCGAEYAVDIHHIQSVKQAPDKIYDMNNLMSLCHECHSKITNKEKRNAPE